MSQRFVPDRNKVTFGPVRTNEKNLERELNDLTYKIDRAEDKGGTTTVTTGGTFVVPGTYEPKVGLPPGVPYLYVIGNLLEGYPVDTTLTGELGNYPLVIDVSNALGLGVDTVIGFTPSEDVIGYSIPAQPVITGFPGTGVVHAVSAGGVVGVLSGADEFYVKSSTGWVLVPALVNYSIASVGPSEDNSTFIITYLPDPTPTGSSVIREVDNTGAIIGTISIPFLADERRTFGQTENGWTLIPSTIGNSSAVGPYRFRKATMSLSDTWQTVPLVGNFDPGSYRRAAIGPTGVAWFVKRTGAPTNQNPTTVYRLDMNTNTIQQFIDVFFDPTATVQGYPVCVTYVSDTICFVGGHYALTTELAIPLILMLAIAPDGSVTLNFEEFTDLPCSPLYGVVSAQQVGTTTVFHMFNILDEQQPYSLLYGAG